MSLFFNWLLTLNTDKVNGSGIEDDFEIKDVTFLNAGDLLNGGGGQDLFVVEANGTISDIQFSGSKSIEEIEVEFNVTALTLELGAKATAAGITLVDAQFMNGALTVDASQYGKNGLFVDAGPGNNTLTGSAFDDIFQIREGTFDANDHVDGGAQTFATGKGDVLRINSPLSQAGAPISIADADLAHVTNIETLEAEDDSGQSATVTITLGTNSDKAGIGAVDAKTAGSVTIDASARKNGITIDAGTGVNDLTGSDKDDVFSFINGKVGGVATALDGSDTVDGGGETAGSTLGDILEIHGDGGKTALTVNDVDLAKVSDVETLWLAGAATMTVNFGAHADAAGISLVDGTAASATLTVNAANHVGGLEVLTGAGTALLTGGVGGDSFAFTSKSLTSADKVDGGGVGDYDRIVITDKAAIVDAAFTNVKNVEALTFSGSDPVADYSGAKVVLGALSEHVVKGVATGITTVENDTSYALTVDASARTTGIDFHGSIGDDVLIASKGADTFDGGAGTDTLQVLGSVTLEDTDFAGFSSVERLVFAGTGKQSLELGTSANTAGISIIDGSKVAGGLNIDATADHHDLAVYAGTGADTILMGGTNTSHGDVYFASTKLTSADKVVGGVASLQSLHFTDAVKLADAYFATNTANVASFHQLLLDNTGANQSLIAGQKFADFLDSSGITRIDATSELSTSGFTFDFSGYPGTTTGKTVVTLDSVNGSGGNDVFIGGAAPVDFFGEGGNDTFKYSLANFNARTNIAGFAVGGDGLDKIVITDAGTVTDANLVGIIDVETLQLGAAKTGSYELTLDTHFDSSGIATIDASQAGVDVIIHGGSASNGVTFLAGAKTNTFTGGDGDDVVAIDAKSFNSGDTLEGGTGADTLKFTTGGVVKADALAKAGGFEYLKLSDAGNSVTLTDAFADSATNNAAAFSVNGETYSNPFDLLVRGGKGSDTVDLSQLTADKNVIGVVAGGGTDKMIGSAGSDVFFFTQTGELTAADQIDGGAGPDAVVVSSGAYSSDQFKGFKNVEVLGIFDEAGSTGSTVTLKNDFMSGLKADASGNRTFSISVDLVMNGDDRIDASAVTGSLNRVNIFSGRGDDTIVGGAGNDVFQFWDTAADGLQLSDKDSVDGGAGRDAIALSNFSGATSTVADDDFAGVHHVEQVILDFAGTVGDDNSLTLGANAAAAGIDEVIVNAAAPGSLILVAKDYADGISVADGLTVRLRDGDDNLTLSTADDTVVFSQNADLDGNDTINGNAGTDTIRFLGATAVTDAQFAGASSVEQIELAGKATLVTLGDATNHKADTAGIRAVDASQAQAGVTVDATQMQATSAMTLTGSSFGDVLKGGAGVDAIYGGLGPDVLTGGGGADTFVFNTWHDSHADMFGMISALDEITDFAAGDKIALGDGLHMPTKVVTTTVFGLLTDSLAGMFKNVGGGGDAVAAYDSKENATYLYIDANNNGSFDVRQDIVIKLDGDARTAVTLGTFVSSSVDSGSPLHPTLTEANAFELAAGKPYASDDFGLGKIDLTGADAVVPDDLKAAYNISLGGTSDLVRFFDWSQSSGALTLDGSLRQDPLYLAASKGANTLIGTSTDDIFYFTGAALAKSTVNGGAGDQDTIFIAEKSTLADAALAKVTNAEILEFGPSPLPGAVNIDVTGQKVALGAKSELAGIETIINDWTVGLSVDASARTQGVTFTGGIGDDVFTTNAAADNSFFGGAGSDSFRSTIANFNDDQHVDLGTGIDEIRIVDSNNAITSVKDDDFTNIDSTERLVFDATGGQFVTLGQHADDAGLSLVDGSKITGGLTLTTDANFKGPLTVIAGTGKDHITFDGTILSGSVLINSTKLTKGDSLDGGALLHFTDAVHLTDSYFGAIKDSVKNFAGGELDLDNVAKGQTLVGGTNFADFIVNSGISNVVAHTTQGFTADFSGYVATLGVGKTNSLAFTGGAGNDVVTADNNALVSYLLGDGDDTLKASSAGFNQAFSLNGGDGNDVVVITDTVNPITDNGFDHISEVETLRLGPAKSGTYTLTLDGKFKSSGIHVVDASQAGVAVDIDAHTLSGGGSGSPTIYGGTKANHLQGGAGNDHFFMDAKTFGTDDTLSGGASLDGDYLYFTSGGVISNVGFGLGQVTGWESILFSDAGNSLIVTDAVVDQSDGNGFFQFPDLIGGAGFDLNIIGGKGADTIDLSAVSAGQNVGVVAGGGTDKVIGGAEDDNFYFLLTGDLTSADTVKGGAGHDIVVLSAGAYGADAFKGVSSIEEFDIVDGVPGASKASIKLNDDAFKGTDTLDDGTHKLSFITTDASVDTIIDASAVTKANNAVGVLFGAENDTFIGGAGRDVIQFEGDGGTAFNLDANDTVDGGLGHDIIILQSFDPSNTLADADLSGVRHVEELRLTGSADFDIKLAEHAAASGIALLDAHGVTGDLTLHAQSDGNDLTVLAGRGKNDDIDLGLGNDVVSYAGKATLDATDAVDGGGGINTFRFTGDTTITDTQFTLVTGSFQNIELVDGTFTVSLGLKAVAASVDTVDASKAGHAVQVSVDDMTSDVILIGSVAGDDLLGGSGNDTLFGGGGADDLAGGLGADTFKYTSTGDSVLLSGNSLTKTDTITGFSHAQGDVIDITAFGLAVVDNRGAVTLASVTGTPSAAFTGGQVVVLEDGGNTFILADTDKDGSFDFNSDLVVKVVGSHASELAGGDLQFT